MMKEGLFGEAGMCESVDFFEFKRMGIVDRIRLIIKLSRIEEVVE